MGEGPRAAKNKELKEQEEDGPGGGGGAVQVGWGWARGAHATDLHCHLGPGKTV